MVSKPSHNVGDMYTMQLGATEKNPYPLFGALSANACFIDPFGAGEGAARAECKYFVQLRSIREYLLLSNTHCLDESSFAETLGKFPYLASYAQQ